MNNAFAIGTAVEMVAVDLYTNTTARFALGTVTAHTPAEIIVTTRLGGEFRFAPNGEGCHVKGRVLHLRPAAAE